MFCSSTAKTAGFDKLWTIRGRQVGSGSLRALHVRITLVLQPERHVKAASRQGNKLDCLVDHRLPLPAWHN